MKITPKTKSIFMAVKYTATAVVAICTCIQASTIAIANIKSIK